MSVVVRKPALGKAAEEQHAVPPAGETGAPEAARESARAEAERTTPESVFAQPSPDESADFGALFRESEKSGEKR